MHIDKILIGEILSENQVGLYEAAVRISSISYFIPVAIVNSAQPAITKAYLRGKNEYYNKLKYIFYFLSLVSFLLALPIVVFSDYIVNFLFGLDYLKTSPILKIHAFSMVFVFVGLGRGLWIITESHFKFQMISTLLGGLSNIILNIIFIQYFGLIGAAYSTLISYFVMYILSGFFYKPAIGVSIVQLKAMSMVWIIDIIRKKNILR